jgi:hypothetical protein
MTSLPHRQPDDADGFMLTLAALASAMRDPGGGGGVSPAENSVGMETV